MHRRGSFKYLTAIACAGLASSCAPKAISIGPRAALRPGISTYTVRSLMERDPLSTVDTLCHMGYREFEFYAAGYFGITPERWQTFLRERDASAPSRMVRLPDLTDGLEETIETSLAAGHEIVALGYVHPRGLTTLDDYRNLADILANAGERLAANGLTFSYHHHAFEFEPMAGTRPMDLLLDLVPPQLMWLTLDTYHVRRANLDPAQVLGRHLGRVLILHLKDIAPDGDTMRIAGEGTIDFAQLLRHPGARSLRHAYIEHGPQDAPLDNCRRALSYLSSIVMTQPPDLSV